MNLRQCIHNYRYLVLGYLALMLAALLTDPKLITILHYTFVFAGIICVTIGDISRNDTRKGKLLPLGYLLTTLGVLVSFVEIKHYFCGNSLWDAPSPPPYEINLLVPIVLLVIPALQFIVTTQKLSYRAIIAMCAPLIIWLAIFLLYSLDLRLNDQTRDFILISPLMLFIFFLLSRIQFQTLFNRAATNFVCNLLYIGIAFWTVNSINFWGSYWRPKNHYNDTILCALFNCEKIRIYPDAQQTFYWLLFSVSAIILNSRTFFVFSLGMFASYASYYSFKILQSAEVTVLSYGLPILISALTLAVIWVTLKKCFKQPSTQAL